MKKCILGTALLNQKNVRRYVNWINYYGLAFPDHDLLLGNDGGEENAPFAEEVLAGVDASVLKRVRFLYFSPFLGRKTICVFPGWRRSFAGLLERAGQEGYGQVVFIETDVYIRKKFIPKYARLFEGEEYASGYSDRYRWMETSLQVLNAAQIRDEIAAFFKEERELMSEVCAERQLQEKFKPLTGKMKGTRLEGGTKNIYDWEYYSQCDYDTYKDVIEEAGEEPADRTAVSTAKLQSGSRVVHFHFRPATSDAEVMRQIFSQKHYDLQGLARGPELLAYAARERAAGRAPLIIDAGANIGASAVYFSLTVPGSKVLALEPSKDNFQLLAMNARRLDIRCLAAAVSAEAGRVRISDPNIGPWGYRTEPVGNDPEGIPSLSINELFAQEEADCFPFIVKLDIEGAERDLFSGGTEWVARTPLIIAELHDWMFPGTANSNNFLKCISAQDRDFFSMNENVFSISNSLSRPA